MMAKRKPRYNYTLGYYTRSGYMHLITQQTRGDRFVKPFLLYNYSTQFRLNGCSLAPPN